MTAAVEDFVEVLRDGALLRITNTDLRSNSYLLADPAREGSCAVIDPGLDHARMDAALADCGWTPRAILCTHGHFDHIGGTARLQQRFGIPVHLRAADQKVAKLANFMLAAFKMPSRIALPEFSLLQDEATAVEAAGRRFVFHALPGHTPGGAGILVDGGTRAAIAPSASASVDAPTGLLFSGDSLYARHTALSRLPGEDHAQLRQSLLRLFGWIDPGVLVLPGHGRSATVADIQANNEELRAFLAAAPA